MQPRLTSNLQRSPCLSHQGTGSQRSATPPGLAPAVIHRLWWLLGHGKHFLKVKNEPPAMCPPPSCVPRAPGGGLQVCRGLVCRFLSHLGVEAAAAGPPRVPLGAGWQTRAGDARMCVSLRAQTRPLVPLPVPSSPSGLLHGPVTLASVMSPRTFWARLRPAALAPDSSLNWSRSRSESPAPVLVLPVPCSKASSLSLGPGTQAGSMDPVDLPTALRPW